MGNSILLRSKVKVRKSHFLLLEVLISFFLVAMCIIPLISSQSYILMEQKKFIDQIELDHAVNLVYADIIEKLYRNQIDWSAIINKEETAIDPSFLEQVHVNPQLPYKGTYRFIDIWFKPTNDNPRKVYLLTLKMEFSPPGAKRMENGEFEGGFVYLYKIFLIRDVAGGALEPVPNQDQDDDQGQNKT